MDPLNFKNNKVMSYLGKIDKIHANRICQGNFFIEAAEPMILLLIIFTFETMLNFQFDSSILPKTCKLVDAKWLHYI